MQKTRRRGIGIDQRAKTIERRLLLAISTTKNMQEKTLKIIRQKPTNSKMVISLQKPLTTL